VIAQGNALGEGQTSMEALKARNPADSRVKTWSFRDSTIISRFQRQESQSDFTWAEPGYYIRAFGAEIQSFQFSLRGGADLTPTGCFASKVFGQFNANRFHSHRASAR